METRSIFIAFTCIAIAFISSKDHENNSGIDDPARTGSTFAKPPANLHKGRYSIFVDYSRSINEERLWLIHNKTGDTVIRTTCSHGYASGENYVTDPSNESGSHKSSIGNFVIAEKYVGRFGN